MPTIEQLRAARAFLNMSQDELAKKAGISTATLNNIERGAQKDAKSKTLLAIRDALTNAGIEFLEFKEGSLGIKWTSPELLDKKVLVLIIDDNAADRKLFKTWLKNQNKRYEVIEASDAKRGYEAFLEHKPDCILLDFMMYGKDGFQLLAELRQGTEHLPPILFMSGVKNDAVRKNVLALGAHAYLDKNILTQERLGLSVTRALEC